MKIDRSQNFLLWARFCRQFDDHKSRLKYNYNRVLHYPNGLEKSFQCKNRFLNNKIFIVQKTKTYESSLEYHINFVLQNSILSTRLIDPIKNNNQRICLQF